MGPKVPAAIAAKQGLFGNIRGWIGDAPAATPRKGEAVVFDMLGDAKVMADGTSDLITVTVLGPEPQLTADTANTLIDQFIEQSQEARGDASGNTSKFLASQLADARKKLQDSENALQEYAHQTGIVIPSETQESVAADKLRQIQTDLAKAETDEADTKAQVETSKENPAESMPQVLDDPTMRDNRARLADLRRQLSDLSVALTPQNYQIQQLNAQIADIEQQSAQHRANVIRRLGVQNSETASRKHLLTHAYQQQSGVVSDQSVKEIHYNSLKKELDANRDLYQSMLQRGKEASTVAAVKASPEPRPTNLRLFNSPMLTPVIWTIARFLEFAQRGSEKGAAGTNEQRRRGFVLDAVPSCPALRAFGTPCLFAGPRHSAAALDGLHLNRTGSPDANP